MQIRLIPERISKLQLLFIFYLFLPKNKKYILKIQSIVENSEYDSILDFHFHDAAVQLLDFYISYAFGAYGSSPSFTMKTSSRSCIYQEGLNTNTNSSVLW